MRIKNMSRFLISLTLMFVAISFLMNMFIVKVFSHEHEQYQNITVSQGETLWSIASSMGGDINKNIYEIKKLNALDSSIVYVGQNLIIPE